MTDWTMMLFVHGLGGPLVFFYEDGVSLGVWLLVLLVSALSAFFELLSDSEDLVFGEAASFSALAAFW